MPCFSVGFGRFLLSWRVSLLLVHAMGVPWKSIPSWSRLDYNSLYGLEVGDIGDPELWALHDGPRDTMIPLHALVDGSQSLSLRAAQAFLFQGRALRSPRRTPSMFPEAAAAAHGRAMKAVGTTNAAMPILTLVGFGTALGLLSSLRRRWRPKKFVRLDQPHLATSAYVDAPAHIGFIMDGNRRHARVHGRSPNDYGPGLDAFLRVMRWCARQPKVQRATFFVLSSENIRQRESFESVLERAESRLIATAKEVGARVRIVSTEPELLSQAGRKSIARVETETAMADPLQLEVDLLVSYGGCVDVAHACRAIARQVAAGTLSPDDVDTELVQAHLATAPAEKPDLVVRTTERRLSNYTMFQAAYSEIAFLEDVFWPDLSDHHLESVVADYNRRTRRYGA